ncbi:MAG: CDP-diacylglycerol--glycerol-3-phosphate 3-phosphatidyltransferase [Clostridia bacterium]|nr:CDP-diacylglycerol--glycerol-3-phosphate 3-phosphatidyltransferase [Clostridia bacterium]
MNLPNRLTVLRLILIPVFAVFFFVTAIPYNFVFALVVFCAAAFTDFLDGYFARKLNMVTNLGKFLDPIADKLLVSTALILLLTVPAVMPAIIGAICVSVIIARELMISAFRQIAAAQNIIMAADMTGKIKTVFQDFAIIVMLLCCESISTGAYKFFYYAGLALLVTATLLSIISAINYIVKNRSVLKN